MAVLSALSAVIVLPSVFADQSIDLSAAIGSGALTITAHGDFTSAIALNSLSNPPLSDTVVSATTDYSTDYFKLTDSTSTDGSKLRIKMSSSDSGNFIYSGSSDLQGNITVSNFIFGPKLSGGDYIAPTIGLNATDTGYIIASETAASAEVPGLYAFDTTYGVTPYTKSLAGTYHDFMISSATAPYAMQVGISKLALTVPAGSNAGSYTSTIVVTYVDGI